MLSLSIDLEWTLKFNQENLGQPHSSHQHIFRSGWISLFATHIPLLWRMDKSTVHLLPVLHSALDSAVHWRIWSFCNTTAQSPCHSAFFQCFLQCFLFFFLFFFSSCMQHWEWIIPCYEFIQCPKGPLICTVENLMNRSQLGLQSYELRLSSSLSSRWTVNRGLQWYTERTAHCWGKSHFLRDQLRKFSKNNVYFQPFILSKYHPSSKHNSLQTSL